MTGITTRNPGPSHGRWELGTRPCWPNWTWPVASQVKKEIRYRNATAPSPDPAPTTRAMTSSPARLPRSQPLALPVHDSVSGSLPAVALLVMIVPPRRRSALGPVSSWQPPPGALAGDPPATGGQHDPPGHPPLRSEQDAGSTCRAAQVTPCGYG